MKEITKLFQSTEFYSLLGYNNLSFVSGEFLADGSYFVLYMSPSHAVLLEIKQSVSKISIKRSIQKCSEVFDRYDIQPRLLILTDKTSSTVKKKMSPLLNSHYWQLLNIKVRADASVIFSKDSISCSEDEIRKCDGLVAFTLYFFGDESERQKLRDTGDPRIKLIDDF